MTQIAIVQAAAPPPPPAGPPANGGSQQFSSHFEKAISARKDQADTRESANENKPNITKSGEKSQTASIDNTDQEAASATVPDQDSAAKDATAPVKDEAIDMQNRLPEQPIALSTEQQQIGGVVFSPPAKNTTAGANTNAAAAAQGASAAFTNISPQAFIASSQVQAEVSPSLPDKATMVPQTGQKTATDTLLAQLQQLIQNSNEKGTVTITREDTPVPVPGIGTKGMQAWPQQVGTNTSQINILSSEFADETVESMLADGWNLPPEKSEQQVSSLRQNTQQQYFEAKINLQSFGKDESAMQDGQKGNESTTQTSVATGQAASTATSLPIDQTNTFAQALTSAQSPTLQPGTEAAKTVTLPSGTIVREEEVIQQVMERFQISRKPLDTQINIKLHPAELGELKIDLTVKEGSIRANVVAQSQHAQEIIERNMSKLRTVLEDHGFTVETITVSAKSDSTSDAGLFDRQLFSQNDYDPQPKKRRPEAEAAFRIDEALLAARPTTTGVNVKI